MKKLIAGFAIIASVVPTAFTFAAEPTAPSGATGEALVAVCTERVANIPTFLADMDARHTTNSAKMQSGIDRLTAFIAKAQEAGSDTSALEANLSSLVAYQQAIATDRAALVTHLTALESFTCTTDALDEWVAHRSTTKTYFDALKSDVAGIQSLRADIKANIQTILDTLPATE